MLSSIRHNMAPHGVPAPWSTDVPELDTAQAAGVHSNSLQALQLFYMNSVLSCAHGSCSAHTQQFLSWNKAAFICIQQGELLCEVVGNIWTITKPPLFE